MARKNRYTGVLKPLQQGKGAPEVSVVLIYDIENDRLRTRIADACMDYGLERIQFSAFFGKMNADSGRSGALIPTGSGARFRTKWGAVSTESGALLS